MGVCVSSSQSEHGGLDAETRRARGSVTPMKRSVTVSSTKTEDLTGKDYDHDKKNGTITSSASTSKGRSAKKAPTLQRRNSTGMLGLKRSLSDEEKTFFAMTEKEMQAIETAKIKRGEKASKMATCLRSGGLVGLKNLGNTCYMNSALQCLSHTVPLTEYFIAEEYVGDVNRANPVGMGGRVAEAYAQLIETCWDSSNSGKAMFTPRGLKSTISKFAPQFMGYDQHDSSELVSFLLDGLHEDLNTVRDKPYIAVKDSEGRPDDTVAAEAWMGYLKRNKSIIVDLFHGQLKSTLTCNRCGHSNTTFDPFHLISLPLLSSTGKRYKTIEQCMDGFTQPETLSGKECWCCPKCKGPQPSTKKLDIWHTPPILIVHLKRFQFSRDSRAKVDDYVDFPLEDWDLTELALGNSKEKPVYDLFAVSNHMGSMTGGHYTAYARVDRVDANQREKWYEFDDDSVSVIRDKQRVKQQSAYMLFYVSRSAVAAGIKKQSLGLPHLWPHEIKSLPVELKGLARQLSSALEADTQALEDDGGGGGDRDDDDDEGAEVMGRSGTTDVSRGGPGTGVDRHWKKSEQDGGDNDMGDGSDDSEVDISQLNLDRKRTECTNEQQRATRRPPPPPSTSSAAQRNVSARANGGATAAFGGDVSSSPRVPLRSGAAATASSLPLGRTSFVLRPKIAGDGNTGSADSASLASSSTLSPSSSSSSSSSSSLVLSPESRRQQRLQQIALDMNLQGVNRNIMGAVTAAQPSLNPRLHRMLGTTTERRGEAYPVKDSAADDISFQFTIAPGVGVESGAGPASDRTSYRSGNDNGNGPTRPRLGKPRAYIAPSKLEALGNLLASSSSTYTSSTSSPSPSGTSASSISSAPNPLSPLALNGSRSLTREYAPSPSPSSSSFSSYSSYSSYSSSSSTSPTESSLTESHIAAPLTRTLGKAAVSYFDGSLSPQIQAPGRTIASTGYLNPGMGTGRSSVYQDDPHCRPARGTDNGGGGGPVNPSPARLNARRLVGKPTTGGTGGSIVFNPV